ncbi:MAG: energy-coupling factor transporter transmembrane protein EcfT [Lachnospiraceae bacterium]|nr:energy-coupling factor transporter transmembrane protein EcfT [Lachnospiraceae bacterium]MBQ9608854.1 energy-coupling factor transporter transmembrane protein EcfT [Lachnospiraceae bacterium]
MGTYKSLLDPRTKLLLVFVEATFVLATMGGESMELFRIIFTVVPFMLLISSKRYKTCIIGLMVLFITWALEYIAYPHMSGMLSYLMLAVITVVTRFLPAYLMGSYVIQTTTVSEFKAAMDKMHVTDKLTIPMCVMFRFFPTVREEKDSINAAMRMRGIAFGGGKVSKMLEYRIVPIISCSAKIGEELSASALTRGLGKTNRRTNICKIGFGIWDYIVFIFVAVTVIYWIYGVFR